MKCGKKSGLNRVAIVSNTSWNIYNFRLNLARALKRNGYEVILIAPYDAYSEKLAREFEYHSIYIDNKGTSPKKDLKTLMEFYKLYKKTQPTCVLHYTIKPNIYGNIACRFLGIKSINNISGLGAVFIKESITTKIVKLLYKYSLAEASKVFFQNSDDMKLFIKYNLVQKDICGLVPGSGVDTEKFKPIRKEQDNNVFKFLLIARMLWDKGIGEYIEAAKIIKQKYKNVEFLLLGEVGVDNPTAILKETIQKWEKEGIIKYLGTTDDVKSEIAKADCIVLPSYREGTSRVLLESASMAKPLITTNVPGCKEVVDDGINGFLCKVKDSEDLADKMERMLHLSEEERGYMGKAGREKVMKEFDERIVIHKYLDAIKSILK